jgi:hypothetical protein
MGLLAIVLAASASVQTPPPVAGPGTIVVTGRRPRDYRAALEACLARHCPVNEDVDATMALAEALYIDGQYHDARTAIRQSLSRNRREARNYPEPVSDLYRANARVARALGLDRDAQFSTREILYTLQAGIPVEDHRHFTARFEIAQSLLAFGQYDQAHRMLGDIAARGRAAGRDDVVAMAELRQLWINHLFRPRGSPPAAELLAMAQSPNLRRSVGAKMLLVRIYGERGDRAEADRLMAELGPGSRRRQLLFNPPYELVQREDGMGVRDRAQVIQQQGFTQEGSLSGQQEGLFSSSVADGMVDNVEDKWIDVGFWIRPDGRVEDIEIVRHRNESSWAEPLLHSISGRRYSTSDGSSTYRLERYTYTAGFDDQPRGRRIATRSPRARVEYFDLSETARPPASRPAS